MQVFEACLASAEAFIQGHAAAAIAALGPADWTTAISGTAAAIAAESALAICAKQLIAEVPFCFLSASLH